MLLAATDSLIGRIRTGDQGSGPCRPGVLSFWMIVVGWVFCIGCERRPADSRPVVTVFAAASAISSVTEVTAAFREETGIDVQCSFAASSALATMITCGAHADLFLSASPHWADVVEMDSPGCQSIDLLGNRLVLIVPRSAGTSPQSLDDLTSADFKKIALADPQGVPAGIYARQALEAAGLWEALEPKLVGAMDVRQALTLVELEVADCGIVFQSDARDSPSVQIAFALNEHDPIVYPLVLMPEPTPGARRLFAFFQSSAAREVFARYGFSRDSRSGDLP